MATASALVFSAVSLELWCGRRRAAGLSPAMARGGTAAAVLREQREEGEARATEWMRVYGGAGRRPDQRGWRWPAAARPSPAYGRHVAVAGWDEAGVRARERGEGEASRAAVWAEREAGLAQQRLPPFPFFF